MFSLFFRALMLSGKSSAPDNSSAFTLQWHGLGGWWNADTIVDSVIWVIVVFSVVLYLTGVLSPECVLDDGQQQQCVCVCEFRPSQGQTLQSIAALCSSRLLSSLPAAWLCFFLFLFVKITASFKNSSLFLGSSPDCSSWYFFLQS